MTLRASVALLSLLVGMVVLVGPARGILEETRSARVTYNSGVIGSGISLYYSHYGELSGSLTEFIRDGWVPANLLNPYTGELIEGDSVDGAPGECSITLVSWDVLELTFFEETRPHVFTYDWEILSGNSMGLSLLTARSHLLTSWAYDCLAAYYKANHEVLPQSIDDLIQAGFWPYEGVSNIVTGEPMLFDSDTPGDMMWEFGLEETDVRLRLPDTPEGQRVFAPMTYPPSHVEW